MDLFNTIVRAGDTFYFRKGSVVTTTPWWRPSFASAHSMLKKIKGSTDIFSRYSASIVGGCLFSWDRTWDLDIQLHSDSLDPEQLEIDFLKIYEVALNESTPPKILDLLISDTASCDWRVEESKFGGVSAFRGYIRWAVIQNPSTEKDTLMRMVDNELLPLDKEIDEILRKVTLEFLNG